MRDQRGCNGRYVLSDLNDDNEADLLCGQVSQPVLGSFRSDFARNQGICTQTASTSVPYEGTRSTEDRNSSTESDVDVACHTQDRLESPANEADNVRSLCISTTAQVDTDDTSGISCADDRSTSKVLNEVWPTFTSDTASMPNYGPSAARSDRLLSDAVTRDCSHRSTSVSTPLKIEHEIPNTAHAASLPEADRVAKIEELIAKCAADVAEAQHVVTKCVKNRQRLVYSSEKATQTINEQQKLILGLGKQKKMILKQIKETKNARDAQVCQRKTIDQALQDESHKLGEVKNVVRNAEDELSQLKIRLNVAQKQLRLRQEVTDEGLRVIAARLRGIPEFAPSSNPIRISHQELDSDGGNDSDNNSGIADDNSDGELDRWRLFKPQTATASDFAALQNDIEVINRKVKCESVQPDTKVEDHDARIKQEDDDIHIKSKDGGDTPASLPADLGKDSYNERKHRPDPDDEHEEMTVDALEQHFKMIRKHTASVNRYMIALRGESKKRKYESSEEEQDTDEESSGRRRHRV